MVKKQTVDALYIKIGKLLLITISTDIVYWILFFNLGKMESMQYLLIGSVIICLIIPFVFIKETILGKITYSILAVVVALFFDWLYFMILVQTAGKILSNF